MKNIKILFISGSIGLGHVTRDIAIAQELRRQLPNADISWLAGHPATLVLENAGETIMPEAINYANDSEAAEQSACGPRLNLINYMSKARAAWKQNFKVFADIVSSHQFDLVIGDETYEISMGLKKHPTLKKFLYVIIYDFVGTEAMTCNPFEKLMVYLNNLALSHSYIKKRKPTSDMALFVGEPEDVPDTSLGFMLPTRSELANSLYKFIGYIFQFDPSSLTNQPEMRKQLGYGSEPLIVASIGGTSIGKELLELCGEAYNIMRNKIPSLQMVLVAGPRLAIDGLKIPNGVKIRQFIPQLYEHFAACDVAIVQGGGTSTLELISLQCPFIYFPIERHFEQAYVARNLERRGAGIQMSLSETTPVSLAEKITSIIGSKVSYPKIPVDGAQKATQLIIQLIEGSRRPANN